MSRLRVDWSTLAWIPLIAGAALLAYGRSLNVFFSQDDFFFLARAARMASVVIASEARASDTAGSCGSASYVYRYGGVR